MIWRLVWLVLVVGPLWGCGQAPAAVAGGGGAPAEEIAWGAQEPAPTAGALTDFYRALRRLQAGEVSDVRIVQIGDSHTAADFFSGQLRALLRQRFGDGGIGTRAAGLPYKGVRQNEMVITQAGRWAYHDSLVDHGATAYGLSGFTATSLVGGARLTLRTVDAVGFDRGFVDYARRPGGGRLEIFVDGVLAETFSTDGAAGVLGHAAFGAGQMVTVEAEAPGIEILDWNTEKAGRGAVLDSFGVVGATARIFGDWNPAIVRRQLGILRPSLIIVAYGTNEGARRDFDAAGYAQGYGAMLGNLRRWAPGSSIVVIEPTDGEMNGEGGWETLPALDQVRFIQSREARAHGAAYWDASAPELQSGGIDGWANRDPPLARADHLHFTPAGYAILANDLYAWLMSGYGN